jgi:hypothetical protein
MEVTAYLNGRPGGVCDDRSLIHLRPGRVEYHRRMLGGSKPRHGPRIVIMTIPRRASSGSVSNRRETRRGRIGGGGAGRQKTTGTGGGGGRGGGTRRSTSSSPSSSMSEGSSTSAGSSKSASSPTNTGVSSERLVSTGASFRCRLFSDRTRRLYSPARMIAAITTSCSKACSIRRPGSFRCYRRPDPGSSSERAIESRMPVSACTFFIL